MDRQRDTPNYFTIHDQSSIKAAIPVGKNHLVMLILITTATATFSATAPTSGMGKKTPWEPETRLPINNPNQLKEAKMAKNG